MAAESRTRSLFISVIHLPHPFNKERPFETFLPRFSSHQQEGDGTKSEIAELTQFQEKTSESQESKSCKGEMEGEQTMCCKEDETKSNELASKFAPHEIALEQIQAKMRKFLRDYSKKIAEFASSSNEAGQDFAVAVEYQKQLLNAIAWAKQTFGMRKKKLLNQLCLRSLFHEICLTRISIIENSSNGSEDHMLLRASISEAQDVINNFKSCLLRSQESKLETEAEIEMWDNYFLERIDNVNVHYDVASFYEKLSEEDNYRYVATESRICYALGLRYNFLDRLESFPEDIRGHLLLKDWILNFVESAFEDIDGPVKDSLSSELLIQLGFRENSLAITTVLSRAEEMSGHVEPIDSVRRFIWDEFQFNPILSDNYVLRFPLELQHLAIANDSFDIELSTGESLNIITVGIVKPDINDERVNPMEHIISGLVGKLSEDQSHILLFHGTDHLSAVDIINRGIDVDLGQPKRDFSDGSGFYLSDNYERSQSWSFSQTRKPAVLVFHIEKRCLEDSKGLNLRSNQVQPEWNELVTAFRNGRATKKLRKSLRTYDFIEGPVASMSERADLSNTDRTVPLPTGESYQLCVISDDFADQIRGYLHTAILFDSS